MRHQPFFGKLIFLDYVINGVIRIFCLGASGGSFKPFRPFSENFLMLRSFSGRRSQSSPNKLKFWDFSDNFHAHILWILVYLFSIIYEVYLEIVIYCKQLINLFILKFVGKYLQNLFLNNEWEMKTLMKFPPMSPLRDFECIGFVGRTSSINLIFSKNYFGFILCFHFTMTF